MFKLFLESLLKDAEKAHRRAGLEGNEWAGFYASFMGTEILHWLALNQNSLNVFCEDEPDDSTDSSLCERGV